MFRYMHTFYNVEIKMNVSIFTDVHRCFVLKTFNIHFSSLSKVREIDKLPSSVITMLYSGAAEVIAPK